MLLLALLLAAGCVGAPDGSGDEVEAASAEEAPSGAATGGSGASASASASAPPTPDAKGNAATAEEAAPAIEIPLAFDGSIPAYAQGCAFVVVLGVCQSAPPATWANEYVLDAEGNATSLVATLTWSAVSPTTEQLGIGLYEYTDEEFELVAEAFGPSPLVLELREPFALRAGWTHAMGVVPGGAGAGVGGGGAFVSGSPQEQPFTIEGELVLSPAPKL